jgi:hypothetical protein
MPEWEIISCRWIPLKTPVSFCWTVPLIVSLCRENWLSLLGELALSCRENWLSLLGELALSCWENWLSPVMLPLTG